MESPRIQFRLSEAVYRELSQAAERAGTTPPEFAKTILTEYLAGRLSQDLKEDFEEVREELSALRETLQDALREVEESPS